MLGALGRRLRLFLRSELDIQKDYMISQLRPTNELDEAGWTLRNENGETHVSGLNFAFNTKDHIHFVRHLIYVAKLVKEVNAKLNHLPDGRVEVQVGQVRIAPETAQELGIVSEVFCDKLYQVESPEQMFVWDVGANVGVASLYFAGVLGYDVAAYELFPTTAAAAKNNIERSGLSDRISLTVAGVGRTNDLLKLPYFLETRGSNGLYRKAGSEGTESSSIVEAEIRDASEVLREVVAQAKGRPILAKFDCEGAEYDIIARLEETGELRSIQAFVMEVHTFTGLDPQQIVKSLTKAGFLVRSLPTATRELGVLFASRMG